MWNNVPDHSVLTILSRPKATNKQKNTWFFTQALIDAAWKNIFQQKGCQYWWTSMGKIRILLVYTLQRSNIHAFCWKMVSSSVAFFKGWRITSTCLQKVINTTCNSLRIHKLKKSMFNECLSVWLRHG